MSTTLLKVPVDERLNTFMEVQVDPSELPGLEESGVALAAAGNTRFETTAFSLSSAMDHVMPALRVVLGRLRNGAHSPDEITMKVGLQVGGEAGVFFAKGTSDATVEVTMTWRHESGFDGDR